MRQVYLFLFFYNAQKKIFLKAQFLNLYVTCYLKEMA
jgi:hypothetical protein